MANILIKRGDQEPFEIPKNQVVAAIKNGELLADDEISLDGQSWVRLDQHKQLGALFGQGEPKPPPAPKPKVMSEAIFYSSDRVNCPKCGFEQDRGDTCESCNLLFEKFWAAHKTRTKRKPNRAFAPELDAEESGGIFHKLWNGKYPLWKTFWLFAVAFPLCAILLAEAFWMWGVEGKMQSGMQAMMQQGVMNENLTPEEQMTAMTNSIMNWFEEIRPYFMAFAAFMLIYSVYAFFVNVGLWRSANNYKGAGIWRILVRIWVVLVFIALPFNVFNLTYDLATGFEADYKQMEEQARQMQEQSRQMQEMMNQFNKQMKKNGTFNPK